MLEFAFGFLDLGKRFLFVLPFHFELAGRIAKVRDLLFDGSDATDRFFNAFFSFFLECFSFDLKTRNLAVRFFKCRRHVLERKAQRRRRFVDKIDGLIRQESLRDVARGKLHRRDHRTVGNVHAVEKLVALFEAAQNGDRVLHARLVDVDRLEAARQRRIVLDVLLIFFERRCADDADLAASERGLQHV